MKLLVPLKLITVLYVKIAPQELDKKKIAKGLMETALFSRKVVFPVNIRLLWTAVTAPPPIQ